MIQTKLKTLVINCLGLFILGLFCLDTKLDIEIIYTKVNLFKNFKLHKKQKIYIIPTQLIKVKLYRDDIVSPVGKTLG